MSPSHKLFHLHIQSSKYRPIGKNFAYGASNLFYDQVYEWQIVHPIIIFPLVLGISVTVQFIISFFFFFLYFQLFCSTWRANNQTKTL